MVLEARFSILGEEDSGRSSQDRPRKPGLLPVGVIGHLV